MKFAGKRGVFVEAPGATTWKLSLGTAATYTHALVNMNPSFYYTYSSVNSIHLTSIYSDPVQFNLPEIKQNITY